MDKDEIGCASFNPFLVSHEDVVNVSLYPSGSVDFQVHVIGAEDIKKEKEDYIKKLKNPFQGYPISLDIMGDPVEFLCVDYPEKHSLTQDELKKNFG